ncbi:autotransporter domain-containing protein [Xanthobacter sediminis]
MPLKRAGVFRNASLRRMALVALGIAAGVAGAARDARAQAPDCGGIGTCNAQLLANFGALHTSPAGMAILEQNLATEIAIYSGSTSARKQTAALDSQLEEPAIYYNIWNHAVPSLSKLFSQGNLLHPGTRFPDNAYVDNTAPAFAVFSSIAGSLKSYFADDPSLASYNAAYHVLPPYAAADPLDPRPFVVSAQINGNPWTTKQTSAIAVAIQQSDKVPPGFEVQSWPNYVTSPAFPSGHSTIGNTLAILTAVMAPQYYKDFVMAGIEFGLSRNVFGVHYPLDVIGGRLIATYNIAQWLNGADYRSLGLPAADLAAASAALQASIGSGGSSPYATACAGNVVACIRAGAIPTAAEFARARAAYTSYLTYGLPDLAASAAAPVVPEGAQVLIASRFPYLSEGQRREILATTELPAGGAFDNGSGWARLNLFAAADGFGALNCGGEGARGCTQVVTMNAARGGYNALDVWANDMAGAGALELAGSGTLVLAGRNSYTGGTSVRGGTLAVTGAIVGPVGIARGAAFYNAGTVGGTEPSLVSNAGTLLNDGTIAGRVENTGTFGNNGTVTGTVASSGLVSGTGRIGGDLAVTAGRIAPGNSAGTLTVGGDVTLAPGVAYAAGIDGSGADRIRAGGTATIDGAALQLAVAKGAVIGLRSFSVVEAAGGVSGRFATVNDPLGAAYPFLDLAVAYGDDGVTLDTTRSDVPFATVARSPNQLAVATALERVPLASGPFADAVLSLNGASAPGAFAALSGEIGASAKGVFVNDSRFLRGAVIDRLRAADAPGVVNDITVAPLFHSEPAAAPFPVKGEPAPAAPSSAVWARGFGAWSSVAGDGNAAALDASTGGVFIGADARLEDWRLGVLGGYSSTDFSVDAQSSSGGSENWHLGLYAGRDFGPLAVRTGLAYSWQSVETSRSVALNGYAGTLNADYDAGTFQAFGELGYGMETPLARIEPFAGLAYVSLHTDGYTEQGGAAALAVSGGTMGTAFTTLGLRAAVPFMLGTARAALSGSLGWQHAFGDVTPASTQSFAMGGTPFTVSGLALAADAALVEAGLRLQLADAVVLGAAYAGQFGDGVTQNGFNASLKIAF